MKPENLNLPPFDSFPNLEATGLLLRRVHLEDVDGGLVEMAYFDGVKANSEVEASEMVEKMEGLYAQGDLLHWGIEDTVTGVLVGSCGFYRGFKDGVGELGGILRPRYQGKGIMQPAMEAAMRFALEEMGLKEIIAITSEGNEPAKKLLEKLGFAYEGPHGEGNLKYVFVQAPVPIEG